MAAKTEKDLKKIEADLKAKEKTLAEQAADIAKREAELAKKAKAGAQPVEKAQKLNKKEQELMDEALDVFGIDPEHVLNSRMDRVEGQAVIVTMGGSRVRYSGKEEEEDLPVLTKIQITGIVPEKK